MKECDIYEHDIHVLISDLKSGQESAFDYLFVTRYKELCRFARRLLVRTKPQRILCKMFL